MKHEEDDSSIASPSGHTVHSGSVMLSNADLSGDADDLSDSPDSDDNMDDDLLAVACQDEITAQLAQAGTHTTFLFDSFSISLTKIQ